MLPYWACHSRRHRRHSCTRDGSGWGRLKSVGGAGAAVARGRAAGVAHSGGGIRQAGWALAFPIAVSTSSLVQNPQDSGRRGVKTLPPLACEASCMPRETHATVANVSAPSSDSRWWRRSPCRAVRPTARDSRELPPFRISGVSGPSGASKVRIPKQLNSSRESTDGIPRWELMQRWQVRQNCRQSRCPGSLKDE